MPETLAYATSHDYTINGLRASLSIRQTLSFNVVLHPIPYHKAASSPAG